MFRWRVIISRSMTYSLGPVRGLVSTSMALTLLERCKKHHQLACEYRCLYYFNIGGIWHIIFNQFLLVLQSSFRQCWPSPDFLRSATNRFTFWACSYVARSHQHTLSPQSWDPVVLSIMILMWRLLWLVSSVHVPSTNMEGSRGYDLYCSQTPGETLWLHF